MKNMLKKQIGAIEIEMKPRLYLDSKILPAIKDWEVGEEYDILLRVKQVGLREREDGGRLEADFVILSAKED